MDANVSKVDISHDSFTPKSPQTPSAAAEHQDSLTLRHVVSMACKSLDIGAAVLPQPLFRPDVQDYGGEDVLHDVVASMETPYARVLRQEFNAVVIEHHLKWMPLLSPKIAAHGGGPSDISPDCQLGRYDFSQADSIVNWAAKHKLKVKGHVLVWHVTSPIKLLEHLEPDQVREELKQHIYTVMGHYRGRIQVWDVVNEALAPDGSLAHNIFYRKLGPSYIEDCFRWAHQADPDAILLYNDNKVERVGSAKSKGFYRLLSDLKSKGVPIHGCGMQSHWNAAGTGPNQCPTPRQLKEQIRRIGELGLTVNLSELDVRVSQLDAGLRSAAQTQIYHDLVAAAISEPACNGVWLWGFTDRHTWVTHFYYDDEPLILDEQYGRKPAYFGLRQALVTLTPQGRVGGDVPLSSDVDHEGTPWGQPWRKMGEHDATEGEEDTDHNPSSVGDGGDARPDWEIMDNSSKELPASDRLRRPQPTLGKLDSDDILNDSANTGVVDLSSPMSADDGDSEHGDPIEISVTHAEKLPEIS